ncbi:hypothetical protein Tco_1108109 [Tanacetum coccineum]
MMYPVHHLRIWLQHTHLIALFSIARRSQSACARTCLPSEGDSHQKVLSGIRNQATSKLVMFGGYNSCDERVLLRIEARFKHTFVESYDRPNIPVISAKALTHPISKPLNSYQAKRQDDASHKMVVLVTAAPVCSMGPTLWPPVHNSYNDRIPSRSIRCD